MSRRRPFPPRPEKAFRIGTVRWNLENVAVHVRAGFAPVPDEVVRAHFFRYVEFLQRQNYLLAAIARTLKEVTPETELRSDDLTLEGFRFVRYSHDRWIGRILKFADTPKENAYLEKWHQAFLKLPPEQFAAADGT
jgi:hypothetical protein